MMVVAMYEFWQLQSALRELERGLPEYQITLGLIAITITTFTVRINPRSVQKSWDKHGIKLEAQEAFAVLQCMNLVRYIGLMKSYLPFPDGAPLLAFHPLQSVTGQNHCGIGTCLIEIFGQRAYDIA